MPVWVLPKSADEIEFHSYSQKMQQYKLYWLCESLRGDTTVQACCTVEEWCDTKWEKKVLYQNTLEYGSVSISMRDKLYAYRKMQYWLQSSVESKEWNTLCWRKFKYETEKFCLRKNVECNIRVDKWWQRLSDYVCAWSWRNFENDSWDTVWAVLKSVDEIGLSLYNQKMKVYELYWFYERMRWEAFGSSLANNQRLFKSKWKNKMF